MSRGCSSKAHLASPVTLATPDRPAFCHRELDITSLQLIIETIAHAKNERRSSFSPLDPMMALRFSFSFSFTVIQLSAQHRCAAEVSRAETFLRHFDFDGAVISLSSLPGFEEDYTD